MKTIEETYRERLNMLADKYGGQIGLSKLIDKSSAQISQWINGSPDSKTGKPRSMKSDTAREIEQSLGLPKAWFDQPIRDVELVENTPPSGYLQFQLFNIKAAAGGGVLNNEYPESIRLIEVSEKWARENLGKNLKSISIITAFGDSMRPTFESGDLLFVDESMHFFENDGVYVYVSPAGLKVKRLSRLTMGELRITSDNAVYSDEILSGDALNAITICGKVVATLRMEKV